MKTKRPQNEITRKQATSIIEALRKIVSEGHHDTPTEELAELLTSNGVTLLKKCEGEAHSNPFIDHCSMCMPHWGFYGPDVKVK